MNNLYKNTESGITLIGLLIAMAISAILIIIIGGIYSISINTSLRQEQLIDLNQDLRTSLFIFQRDLFMAGYQPAPLDPAGVGIIRAEPQVLEFSYVTNDKDNTFDIITYSLINNVFTKTVDPGNSPDDESFQVADNIEEIQFIYTFRDNQTNTTDRNNDPDHSAKDIVAVTISILARSEQPVPGDSNTKTYLPYSNGLTLLDTPAGETDATQWGPYNDSFPRKLIISTFFCRNLAIKNF